MTDPTTLDINHHTHPKIDDIMVTDWGIGDGTRRISLISHDGAMWTLNLNDKDRVFLLNALEDDAQLPLRTWS